VGRRFGGKPESLLATTAFTGTYLGFIGQTIFDKCFAQPLSKESRLLFGAVLR
jgi:hypothetical protein